MVLHENNSIYITQIKGEYIKSDQTKDVSPKFALGKWLDQFLTNRIK